MILLASSMLCSAGDFVGSTFAFVWASAAYVPKHINAIKSSFFIPFLNSQRSWLLRSDRSSHEGPSVDWADSAGLTRAAFLAWANVHAVTTAIGRQNVRKRRAVTEPVEVDSITDPRTVLHGVCENSGNRAGRDVYYVIDRPASV